MASPEAPSGTGVGRLFACAVVTSLCWYLFWMVMAPVEQDVSTLINWVFFIGLHLREMVNFYNLIKGVHSWLPLLLVGVFLLSKFKACLFTLARVVYVVIIVCNLIVAAIILTVGRKIFQFFMVTLPLYILYHCGQFLTQIFPLFWLPSTFSLLLYYLLCRLVGPSVDKHSHRCCGIWEPSLLGAVKRLSVVFLLPLLMTGLTYWLMEMGCRPCSTTPGFEAKSPPPKPKLIGHRGCAFDFPENSLAAYKSAVLLPDVAGLETDVFVSMDGVPYLMHDKHLVRTTDVGSKCPLRYLFANATLLYYHKGACPLERLHVGHSFLESGGTNVSPQDRTLYQLPTFRQYLDVAVENKKFIIFDLYKPPKGHPFHTRYLNRTLQDIVASGIPHEQVWWLPDEGREWIHQTYPHLRQTTKSDVTPFERLQGEHIQQMNDDWGLGLEHFRRYQRANLSVNMYFVDSLFTYSFAWCVGAETVTTSNCKLLSSINTNPFLQICWKWRDSLHESHSVLVIGMVILVLETLLLMAWEAFKLNRLSVPASAKPAKPTSISV